MKIHILGTGNGAALKCYNTCFAIENNSEYFLVDGGGGNQILNQLKIANVSITKIHDVFLSHNHTDHILGVIWVLREVCHKMMKGNEYVGNLNVYGSDESMNVLKHLIELLFPMVKRFEDRIFFNVVNDKETLNICDMNITFFDIHAKKEKQYGFFIGEKFAFLGDEPLKEDLFDYVKNKEWVIHESLCLESEKEEYNPHKIGHCTVKEASVTAKAINASNLILVHTEDNDLNNRKELYTKEAKEFFNGDVYVPNDLDIIEL